MFRFFLIVFEILSLACAVLSPVAIGHWLAKTVLGNVAPFKPILDSLSSVFQPFNDLLAMVIKAPTIQYNDQNVDSTQALLAISLTFMFFVFSILAKMCKAAETQLIIQASIDASTHKRKALMQVQKESQEHLKRYRHFMVLVSSQFDQSPELLKRFEANLNSYSNRVVSDDQFQFLHFQDLTQCLNLVQTLRQNWLDYYKTLRPMDPQPPFRIVILATENTENQVNHLERCQQIATYCANNQIICSQVVGELIQHRKLGTPIESIGVYTLGGYESEEFYRLAQA
jgi:hypothetical protein